jgi:endo-alpha-1,4-polygalactosaminidase (GH114 family)
MRRISAALLVLLLLFPLLAQAQQLRWVCYYAADAPVSTLTKFDLFVFDSDAHPAIAPLKERGKTAVGYLSIGEVNSTRAYFADVKTQNLILTENKNWKGSFFVDVRNPLWTQRILEDLIPKILHSGFDGVFLDTVDNAPYLEQTEPQRYRGMSDAMVSLIKTIRRNYPSIKIVVNRGFDILPKIEGDIDMVLGESIVDSQVTLLKHMKKRRPSLTILTLDYVDPKDRNAVIQAYRRQRANGFNPYVSTRELNMIFEEPAP